MPSFPADSFGNPVPVLPVKYGSSQEAALPTAAAVAIGDGTAGQIIRVWALGCDMYYHFGASGIAAPTSTAALVLNGSYFDVPLSAGQTHFRGVVRSSGSGSYRLELLGA